MAKKFQIEQPWFGSFTPASEGGLPPVLVPVEEERLPTPEALPPVPNTYPAGRTYEGFLYELIQDMEEDILALGGGTGFMPVITSPTDGDLLIYDSGSGNFVNVTQDSVIGGPYLPLVGGTITGSPGTLTINAPNAFTGNILLAEVNGSRRFLVDADGDAIFELTDTSNSGPTATVRISHRTSSGTPTTGFGSALQYWGEDTAHTNVEFATIRTEASDNTPGAVSADLVFLNKIAGTSTEGLRFKGADGRALFAGSVQTPALHVGDLTTHPATAHISRAGAVSNPSVYPYLRVKPVNDLAISTGITPILVDLALNSTQQLATGARASVTGMQVVGTTWSAVAASTIDIASGVFLNSLPIAGSNVTMTERYALYVNGATRFDASASEGITFIWKLPTDNTALTGGIVGRIPINIGGALKYIPYYTS